MKKTTDEYIKQLASYELRTYAKELGCPNPTKLTNPQLIEFIIENKEAYISLVTIKGKANKKQKINLGIILGFLSVVIGIIAWLFPKVIEEDIEINKEVRIPINLIHDYNNGFLYSLADKFYIKPEFNTTSSISKFGIYGVDYVRLNPIFEKMQLQTALKSPIDCPIANSILEYSFLRWLSMWPQAYDVMDYIEQEGASDTRGGGVLMDPIVHNLDSINIVNLENELLSIDSLKLLLPKSSKIFYDKNVIEIRTEDSSISFIFERLGSNPLDKNSKFAKQLFNITRLNPNINYQERRYVIRIIMRNLNNKKTKGLEYETKWFDKISTLAKKEFSFENIKKEYISIKIPASNN